ncbi:hypothetical protein HCY58_10720 [Acinetobacter radioresistens]|uniref:hypothetical protein n=1 Tax=Acinetobacter radioresistens TaxID=40216 RepID=UPI0020034C81|nr:hypothetical protein [Acinetobacter radioresistens]MCK4087520.1 hypothetical protein [Acinetobacter radioresistens]
MDIQKDEAFELAFSKTDFYKGMVESLKNKDCPFESVFEIRNGKYRSSYVHLSHEIWQAAQAVPEGFVLVEKDLIKSIYQSCIECLDVDIPPIFRATVCTIRDEVESLIEAQEST